MHVVLKQYNSSYRHNRAKGAHHLWEHYKRPNLPAGSRGLPNTPNLLRCSAAFLLTLSNRASTCACKLSRLQPSPSTPVPPLPPLMFSHLGSLMPLLAGAVLGLLMSLEGVEASLRCSSSDSFFTQLVDCVSIRNTNAATIFTIQRKGDYQPTGT